MSRLHGFARSPTYSLLFTLYRWTTCCSVLQTPAGPAAPEPNPDADVPDAEQLAETGCVSQTETTDSQPQEADAAEDAVARGARMRAEGSEGESHKARPFKVCQFLLLPFFSVFFSFVL